MHEVLELLVRELDRVRGRRRPRRSRPRPACGSGSRPRPRTPCPRRPAAAPRRGSRSIRSSWNVTSPSQSRPSQRSDSWIWSIASATSRLVSVFSIRRRNSPPSWRAKSQLKSAVRTLPMWRKPVGLGAMRTMGRHPVGRIVECVLIGAHGSSGGINTASTEAEEMGADVVQLFVQSPQDVAVPEPRPGGPRAVPGAARGGRARRRPRATRSTSSTSRAPNGRSTRSASQRCARRWTSACAIEADGVVFHVGSHLGAGFDDGLSGSCPALEQVLERCSDDDLAADGEHRRRRRHDRPLDRGARRASSTRSTAIRGSASAWTRATCTRPGSTSPTRRLWTRCSTSSTGEIGLDRLRALHVNDSKAPLGSNRDRHENIGEGLMGDSSASSSDIRDCRACRQCSRCQARTATARTPSQIQKTARAPRRWAAPVVSAGDASRGGASRWPSRFARVELFGLIELGVEPCVQAPAHAPGRPRVPCARPPGRLVADPNPRDPARGLVAGPASASACPRGGVRRSHLAETQSLPCADDAGHFVDRRARRALVATTAHSAVRAQTARRPCRD